MTASKFPALFVYALYRVTLVACAAGLTPRLTATENPLAARGTIDSGAPWYDTDGKPINAHAGGILSQDGIYYWYGEIKAGETTLPASNANWGGTRVALSGVSCYASNDLLHWRNLGNVLPADPNIVELRPDRVLERPKVIYNKKTHSYVMWMHIDSADYKEAKTGVAVASSAAGPFHFIKALRPNAQIFPEDMPEDMRREFEDAVKDRSVGGWVQKYPQWKVWARDFSGGQMARDMALFVDDDGTAYELYASEENVVMHISQLSPDYTEHAGKYRRITFDSREAPAPFKVNGKYYLATSGCTGWAPNDTRLYSAKTPLGEWKNEGSFFSEDTTAASVSYLSQCTFVNVVSDNKVFLMADRWEKNDLENSRYVWLPVVFLDGNPRAVWKQVWSLSKLVSSPMAK